MRYEILNDSNEVINTILAEPSFVESTYPDRYRLIEPEPVVIPPKTIFTKLEFRNRFTFAELVAIEEEAITDAGIRVFQTNLNVAEFIDITDANTISGMDYLVTKTLLTELRKTEILTAV